MIEIDTSKCMGCGACASNCVAHNIDMVTRGEDGEFAGAGSSSGIDAGANARVANVLHECFLCGQCVAICPEGAPRNPYYQEELVTYDPETCDLPTQNVVNTVKLRRSIRNFAGQAILHEIWHMLTVDVGGHTPTAKNRQQNRFYIIQNQLPEFKDLIWSALRQAYEATTYEEEQAGAKAGQPTLPADYQTIGRMLANYDEGREDYLFRNAPSVLCIESADPLDGGLAAGAIEMAASTVGLGVLYNGYLRRAIEMLPQACAFLDREVGKPLAACMLVGYPDVVFERSAPRRRPSVILR